MRILIFAAVLLAPFAANAGSIDLDPGIYWQVQNASDYETRCEGFITECDVEPGVYNVINLTTGERQEGVTVASESQAVVSKPEIVKKVCDWTSTEPLPTDITVPGSLLSYANLPCETSCPAGKVIVGTIECSLATDETVTDLLTPVYFPTTLVASENGASCLASRDVLEVNLPIATTVIVACQ